MEYVNNGNYKAAKFRGTHAEILELVSVDALIDSDLTSPSSIWGDLLKGEGSLGIVGPAKSGKTFFAMQLALHIAEGTPFLGLDTIKTGVLYLNYEMPEAELRDRFEDIKMADAIGKTQTLQTVHMPPGMYLNESDGKSAFQYVLAKADKETGGCGVVIIDPRINSMSGNENSAGDVEGWVDSVKEVTSEFGTALVVVHHTGKNLTSFGGRGSSVFDGALDSFITIPEDQSALSIKGRYVDEESLNAQFTYPRWVLSEAEVVKRSSALSRAKEFILGELDKTDASLGMSVLRIKSRQLGHSTWAFTKALDELESESQIKRGHDPSKPGNNKIVTRVKVSEKLINRSKPTKVDPFLFELGGS